MFGMNMGPIMSAKDRLVAYSATYLAVIWVVASIPLATAVLEFGGISLCTDISLGWFIATLYGSFFIYPVAIGGLSMAALVLPMATVLSQPKSHASTRLFAGFYVLTTLIIAMLEFLASPNALFQIPPHAITANVPFF